MSDPTPLDFGHNPTATLGGAVPNKISIPALQMRVGERLNRLVAMGQQLKEMQCAVDEMTKLVISESVLLARLENAVLQDQIVRVIKNTRKLQVPNLVIHAKNCRTWYHLLFQLPLSNEVGQAVPNRAHNAENSHRPHQMDRYFSLVETVRIEEDDHIYFEQRTDLGNGYTLVMWNYSSAHLLSERTVMNQAFFTCDSSAGPLADNPDGEALLENHRMYDGAGVFDYLSTARSNWTSTPVSD